MTSAAFVDDGSPVDPARLYGYATVDSTFAALRRALLLDPDSYTATFDRQLGYPRHVYIDRYAHAADDEYGFTISEFTAVTP
jgi:hypothetical protein